MHDGGLASGGRDLPALVCLSHLRWDFVFQRPQHLMTRFARDRKVVFFEEPEPAEAPGVRVRTCPQSGVVVATPQLPHGLDAARREAALRTLFDGLLEAQGIARPVLWYYTPMMLGFTRHVAAAAIVYDCMDELSAFRFAPPEMTEAEEALFAAADVVFTGGFSLYERKRRQHRSVHLFPSSVDFEHFAKARLLPRDAAAQPEAGGPRLGYVGVIDERIDLDLLAALADAHPEWTIVMIGPVVKIDPTTLPQRPNLHYVGPRSYAELPAHLAGWDVALMPFALNEATRFISPTKTPEYLASGRPVASTGITDVRHDYGTVPGVHIGDGPAFVTACEEAMALAAAPERWRAATDAVLARSSWDRTQQGMDRLVREAVGARATPRPAPAARRGLRYDYLVVGAGFAGSVLAERLAADAGRSVLLIDRRPHIAGNAYDHRDDAGILVHRYGPHIFHTNSDEVVRYLSRFTRWRPYEHRVLARVPAGLVPMPINRTTLNLLYDLKLSTDAEAEAFLARVAEPCDDPRTSEDIVVSKVGRELYETFFRGYTRKQWGLDPSELDKSVAARVPARTGIDDRYFTDRFQQMPLDGYTRLFENMLDHDNIELALGTEFSDVGRDVAHKVIFTGPIDEFYAWRYGPLPYRSLIFRHETLDCERFQPVGTVNEPDEAVPYTRITEFKHLTGQIHPRTSIAYEYPSATGAPYYPIPRPDNYALLKRYEDLAAADRDVLFAGRLASYRYFNMDQVVGQALATYRRMREAGGAPAPALAHAAS